MREKLIRKPVLDMQSSSFKSRTQFGSFSSPSSLLPTPDGGYNRAFSNLFEYFKKSRDRSGFRAAVYEMMKDLKSRA